MGLLDEHQTERRNRIRKAARQLVGERGYDSLTMRELAVAAQVSVQTLYNLFGSKEAILIAELQAMAASVAAAVPTGNLSFFQRALVGFNAGMRLLEEAPGFCRAICQLVVTSGATDEMRQRIEDAFVSIMKANLDAAKKAGQLADWAEPAVVARHIWAILASAFLAWGLGQVDFPSLRLACGSGSCHILHGVARGRFQAEVEARLRELRQRDLPAVAPGNDTERGRCGLVQ